MYKVRKRTSILKELKTNWLTFNPKSFPHLHETPFDIGSERFNILKQ